MNPDDVLTEIDCWLEDSIVEGADSFYIEKYEHAAIIRSGSKRGDFPTIGSSAISGESYIIISGEVDGTIVISDIDAKTPINVKQLAYKYFLETQMKDCDKGYEIITEPLNGEVFNIKVERIIIEDIA